MILESAKAVVSGGASGLGRAVAQRIVDTGGQVALLDVNDEAGHAAVEALGERAFYITTDVSNEQQVDAAVAAANERFGGVTLAVNCAGILGAGRVLGRDGPMPGEQFARVIQVNLIGSFLLAKAAAAVMAENPENVEGERGVIVNTASVAAYEGQIGQAAYAASKAGVAGMTLPMAREFARIGVRVVTIAPGLFHTPMMDGMPEHVRESLGQQVPFPSRLGKPDEYAQMVAAVYANPMLNGTTIRLDGAIRMQPK
ncbi:MAG: SDR family NAD(P)-dependent oxidoreductase [Gammaproteobacteria bacterium]|nr:SDR family NAD(P)-dependent oxidoreductase [Gammaproteobacteria bacterium]NND60341.1 SDR family NAD(P)-dependent oxidoreductase [Gammaproteobacteria bacterium]